MRGYDHTKRECFVCMPLKMMKVDDNHAENYQKCD